jgi:hypothetical protein
MLSNLSKTLYLCVDGTYNLALQKSVGVVVGALDPGKKIHPVAIALVMTENTEAYTEVIRQLDAACYGYFFKHLSPLVLQADGAWEITNGVNQALFDIGSPFPARASCAYHVKAKIRSNLLGSHQVGKQLWGWIAGDFDLLRESFSRRDFCTGVKLFFQKWEAKCTEMESGAAAEATRQLITEAEELEECSSQLGCDDVLNLLKENQISEEDLRVLNEQSVISETVLEAVRCTLEARPVEAREEPPPVEQPNTAARRVEKKGLKTALNYLRGEYLNPDHFRSNFYSGCLPEAGRWCSKTDCATEGFNNSLKTVANNNRIPSLDGLIRSLTHSPMMNISMESRNRDLDTPPIPSREMLRVGAILHDVFGEVALRISDVVNLDDSEVFRDKTVYVFKNEDVDGFEISRIKSFLLSDQQSFSEYRKDKRDFCAVAWKRTTDFTVSPPDGPFCTCTVYSKKNCCAHVVCVAIVLGGFVHDSIARVPIDRRTHMLNGGNIGNKSKYGIVGPVVPARVNGRSLRKRNALAKKQRQGYYSFIFLVI